MLFVIAALFMGSNQTANAQLLDNKGAWVVVSNQNYEVTLQDVLEFAGGVTSMKAGEKYKFSSSGETFYVVNPKEWVTTMKEILSQNKGSAVTNIKKELIDGDARIVDWNDDIPPATNMGMTKDGKSYVASQDYKGGDNVRVLICRGFPVLKLKKPCFNPQRSPKAAKSAPEIPEEEEEDPAPVPKEKHDHKPLEKKKGSCDDCDVVVVKCITCNHAPCQCCQKCPPPVVQQPVCWCQNGCGYQCNDCHCRRPVLVQRPRVRFVVSVNYRPNSPRPFYGPRPRGTMGGGRGPAGPGGNNNGNQGGGRGN